MTLVNKWFYINLFVFMYAIIFTSIYYHGIHMLIGVLGLTFILYNWTRHAVFSTIRTSKSREKKIKYAHLSKKVLPIHKWTGTSALIIILFHAYLVINRFGLLLNHIKMISGLIAGLILLFMVLSGWLRWYRTTVKRRYIHWVLGFILFSSIVVHLLL